MAHQIQAHGTEVTDPYALPDTQLIPIGGPGGDQRMTVLNIARYVAKAPISVNAQTGTSYTLVLTDGGKVIEINNASPITVNIPLNASVAFPINTTIEIYQQGAGQITVAAGSITLRAPAGAKTAVQYASLGLRKRATDEWVVTGYTAV